MKNLPKIPPSEDLNSKDDPSPAMQLMATFQDNISGTVFSIVSALVAVFITVMVLVNWRKKELEAEVKERNGQRETISEERKEKNEVDETNFDGNNSVGQAVSEEELPWLLRKAPSETSLTNKVDDEKHSDGSGSEKSQESVRASQKGCGDSQVARSIKIITADDDYVFAEE